MEYIYLVYDHIRMRLYGLMDFGYLDAHTSLLINIIQPKFRKFYTGGENSRIYDDKPTRQENAPNDLASLYITLKLTHLIRQGSNLHIVGYLTHPPLHINTPHLTIQLIYHLTTSILFQ